MNETIKIKNFFEGSPFMISDTHFFHDKIYHKFEPCRQSFASSREEFDQKMIEALKRTGGFCLLGDLVINSRNRAVFEERIGFVGEALKDIPKVLLMGNHDRGGEEFFKKTGWIVISCGFDLTGDSVTVYKNAPPFLVTSTQGKKVFLSHEPVLAKRTPTPYETDITRELGVWFERLSAEINVHGHIHSKSMGNPSFVNVSAEALNFRPQKLSAILQKDMER